jgi:hypothetical protein
MTKTILLFALGFILLTGMKPVPTELKETFDYLATHPQTASNYSERLAHLKKIDEISAYCSDTLYFNYLKGAPVDYSRKEAFILAYLDAAVDRVLQTVQQTQNTKDENVYLYHIYNMGYLIQYKNELLGIDINCRDAARFAPYLTALLNTHKHADHYNNDLIAKMTALHKPFVSNWYDNNFKTNKVTSLKFGSFSIRTSIGDHHYWSGNRNDMLMFEIGIKNLKIFHAGDNSNIGRIKELKNIDYFIAHHEVGFSWNDAITVVQPKVDIISHIMELGHSIPSGWRWTYAHADEKNQKRGTYSKGLLLSWGERLKL